MSIFSHPIKKLTILGIFAGGYVLGAKAGRERYEQIVRTAKQVKDDPRVHEATSRAEDLVRETATKVTEDPRVRDAASYAQDAVRDATASVTKVVGDAKGDSSDKADITDNAGDAGDVTETRVNPLLADEHFETVDEVVYSSGPDIEESVDELRPTTDADRT